MRIIHLEDYGQDFTSFIIDGDGKIVATRPCQGWFWNGKHIHPDTISVGERPFVGNPHTGAGGVLKYPIVAIEDARACRACGCTENYACMTADGPCHWVEDDLCSNPDCVAAAERSETQAASVDCLQPEQKS